MSDDAKRAINLAMQLTFDGVWPALGDRPRSAQEAVSALVKMILHYRGRVAEIAEAGCTKEMLTWAESDLKEGLSCTVLDRCSHCRCREVLTSKTEWIQ
jgi:hypothetical protein